MVATKPAATILLGRDNDGIFEVLLLKRNKALAFAGGLWVFPGGKIEADEIAQFDKELDAAKLAASRETKEEANLSIDPKQLVFYRHWTTPVIEPRRFATYFFYAKVDMEHTQVQIDDNEIKEHLWINPAEALQTFKTGKLAMLPPTLMSLQLIHKCKTASEAESHLKKETPIFVLPVLDSIDGKMICIYEGDAGYPNSDASAEGPRHRLILDFANKDFRFEYKDCAVLPVNGGMHL